MNNDRLMDMYRIGLSLREISARTGISTSTVRRRLSTFEDYKSIARQRQEVSRAVSSINMSNNATIEQLNNLQSARGMSPFDFSRMTGARGGEAGTFITPEMINRVARNETSRLVKDKRISTIIIDNYLDIIYNEMQLQGVNNENFEQIIELVFALDEYYLTHKREASIDRIRNEFVPMFRNG